MRRHRSCGSKPLMRLATVFNSCRQNLSVSHVSQVGLQPAAVPAVLARVCQAGHVRSQCDDPFLTSHFCKTLSVVLSPLHHLCSPLAYFRNAEPSCIREVNDAFTELLFTIFFSRSWKARAWKAVRELLFECANSILG